MTINVNGIARHWRLRAQRYRLTGHLCTECGAPSFPPRRVCLSCAERIAWIFGDQFAVIDLATLTHQPTAKEKRAIIA